MLFNNQPNENQEKYISMLRAAGAISNLFSDNDAPYLVSRNVENAYCEAFDADNLGRSDCSADASLNGVGVGLKTFIHMNGNTLQKVAEFNKDAVLYRNQQPKELITTVSILRNERIDLTMRTYGLTSMIYHCVTRKPGKILIFEMPMSKIDIPNIKNVTVSNKNTITFEDGINAYSFNLTKSTLYKRFKTLDPIFEIDVEILENPYLILSQIVEASSISAFNLSGKIHSDTISLTLGETPKLPEIIIADPPYEFKDGLSYANTIESLRPGKTVIISKQMKKINKTNQSNEFVILPLFSDRGNKRHVPERSGLNQWNASGRPRHHDEVYIPIPRWIHNAFPSFFPARDQDFNLRLPDKSPMVAKVCQDGSKALMSNPNRDLGEWLLRKVLKLEERELLEYEKLEILGIDSVIVHKISQDEFTIDFCEIGSYDLFEVENKM